MYNILFNKLSNIVFGLNTKELTDLCYIKQFLVPFYQICLS